MTFDCFDYEDRSLFEGDGRPKLLAIGREDSDYTRHPRAMHTHEGRLEILLVTQGNGVHTIDGKTYYTAKGDLLVYNSGSLHEELADMEGGMNVFYCAVTDLSLAGLEEGCLVPPGYRPVVPCGSAYGEVEALFSLMYDHAASQKDTRMEYLTHLMQALLVRIHQLVVDQPIETREREWELGDAIRRQIDSRYLEDLSLRSLAESLKISPYYLSHVFKATTGYSPIQYVIRRRIGQAQSYLMHSDMSIADIAEAVGYKNVNHFHNAFTKCVGIAPGKYRKNFGTRHAKE